jgi:putative zinc finger protein
MTCTYAVNDGAYVLGALAPAERAGYEQHLATCPTCREAVAALAVLPGLLGRLDAAAATAIGATAIGAATEHAPDAGRVPGGGRVLGRTLQAAAEQRHRARRTRRWRLAVAGVGMSAVLLGVMVAVHTTDLRSQQPHGLVAMQPVSDHVPVSAEIGLVPVAGGTRIDMRCEYHSATADHDAWVFRLYVIPRTGQPDEVGTWWAAAGQVLTISAMTYLSRDAIDHIELRRANGTPLLTWHPT